eukprot:13010407-Alexandrium_andersonii.AAC.1
MELFDYIMDVWAPDCVIACVQGVLAHACLQLSQSCALMHTCAYARGHARMCAFSSARMHLGTPDHCAAPDDMLPSP